MARAYFGAYAASKAALEALVRTYAAECDDHQCARQSVQPGPDAHAHDGDRACPASIRRRCRRRRDVAETIVPLCLPSCSENGKLYDFRAGKFLEFRAPA